MKTIIQIALLCYLAALLSGCNEQPAPAVLEVPEPIGSDISTLASTRGTLPKPQRGNTIITKDSIKSMGIFGYSTKFDVSNPVGTSLASTTPNLIYNQKATRELVLKPNTEPKEYELSEWTYTPMAYWPIDLSLRNSFFAYSPHSSDVPNSIVSLSTATGNPKLTYTLPEAPQNMVDVLYSSPVLNKNRKSTEQVNNGSVVYDMKHAMCWLSFVVATSVYGEDTTAEYEVDWIAFMADNLPTTATLDLATGSWSDMTTDYRLFDFDLIGEDGTATIPSGQASLVIDENSRLILLPFTIDDSAGATIDITFWYKGVQYYYFAPFPTQRLSAGNISVFVINISPEGATLTFQSEDRIDNWLKAWEKETDGGDRELDIF